MNQGKARLLLGTSCVGFFVVVASTMLWFGMAEDIYPTKPVSSVTEFSLLLALFSVISLLMIPFDVLGGLVIPSKFEHRPMNKRHWWKTWTASVLFQVVLNSTVLFIYLQIGRAYGVMVVLATFVTMQILLLHFQCSIWKLLSFRSSEANTKSSTFYVANHDHRFTGGVTGLPGFESIVIPLQWKENLSVKSLETLQARRKLAIQSGARWRGIFFAMTWNLLSLGLAIFMTASAFTSVASMVTLLLWFVLFSFLGLLCLPTLNRASVFGLDRLTQDHEIDLGLRQTFAEIDQLTEQDPSRGVSSESVFQPIPCPDRRIAALDSQGSHFSPAWNVARTAIFLSWAFGGPLSRAVHCNVGRPELWAILPTD